MSDRMPQTVSGDAAIWIPPAPDRWGGAVDIHPGTVPTRWWHPAPGIDRSSYRFARATSRRRRCVTAPQEPLVGCRGSGRSLRPPEDQRVPRSHATSRVAERLPFERGKLAFLSDPAMPGDEHDRSDRDDRDGDPDEKRTRRIPEQPYERNCRCRGKQRQQQLPSNGLRPVGHGCLLGFKEPGKARSRVRRAYAPSWAAPPVVDTTNLPAWLVGPMRPRSSRSRWSRATTCAHVGARRLPGCPNDERSRVEFPTGREVPHERAHDVACSRRSEEVGGVRRGRRRSSPHDP